MLSTRPKWWICLLNVKNGENYFVENLKILGINIQSYEEVDKELQQLNIHDHKLSSKIHHMLVSKAIQ
jgi:hypothetical protein